MVHFNSSIIIAKRRCAFRRYQMYVRIHVCGIQKKGVSTGVKLSKSCERKKKKKYCGEKFRKRYSLTVH